MHSQHGLPPSFVDTLRDLQGLVSSVLLEAPPSATPLIGKRAGQQPGGAPRRRVRRKGPSGNAGLGGESGEEDGESEEDLPMETEDGEKASAVANDLGEKQAVAKVALSRPDIAKFMTGCVASLVTLADCLLGEAKNELAKAYKDARGTLPNSQTGSGVTAAIQKHCSAGRRA